jgi:hypothetical protein
MIPQHYSRDIAQRCQTLIRDLRSAVQGGLPGDAQFGGELSTTFLLAMATPMLVLPIERLFKPARPGASQVGDDRRLDPDLAREVDDVFGSTFSAAPFVVPGRWGYVPGYPYFNVANIWPGGLLESLGMSDAFRRADGAPAAVVLRDLRNALAHGGIAYLDADGRQAEANAAMLAFAGVSRTGLNILRVSEDDFCSFLMAWADWLAHPPIRRALNELDPLAA